MRASRSERGPGRAGALPGMRHRDGPGPYIRAAHRGRCPARCPLRGDRDGRAALEVSRHTAPCASRSRRRCPLRGCRGCSGSTTSRWPSAAGMPRPDRRRDARARRGAADRNAETLKAWLRSQPGIGVVCRDGSGAYGEAIRRRCPVRCNVEIDGTSGTRRRSRPQGGLRAFGLRGARRTCDPRGQARREQSGTPATRPRPTGQRRRAARMRPQTQPRTQHRETLRPRAGTRAAHPRRGPPPHASRPVPRSPGQAPRRRPAVQSCNSSTRSRPWATQAARTCSTGTSPMAASNPTAPTSLRGG